MMNSMVWIKCKRIQRVNYVELFINSSITTVTFEIFTFRYAAKLETVKGYFSSWTDAKCLLKWNFCENVASQILQLLGFSFSWTDWIFVFNCCLSNSRITYIAFERLFTFMNCLNMFIQAGFLSKARLTYCIWKAFVHHGLILNGFLSLLLQ